jgi:hypothetical protein
MSNEIATVEESAAGLEIRDMTEPGYAPSFQISLSGVTETGETATVKAYAGLVELAGLAKDFRAMTLTAAVRALAAFAVQDEGDEE